MREIKSACVIGAGAYGSALSEVFSENIDIIMLGLDYETMESINNKHINPKCLCDVRLRNNIKCRCDYDCCHDVDLIFVVTPVSAVRVVCKNLIENKVPEDIPVIMCSKGIENETCKFTTEIAEELYIKTIYIRTLSKKFKKIRNDKKFQKIKNYIIHEVTNYA